MYAKLILVAQDISFDDEGHLSAGKLALDITRPNFPSTLEKMDLLTIWTRGKDEPDTQNFQLSVMHGDQTSPPEQITVRFGENYEAMVGLSLDGFVLESARPYIFRFTQNGEDRGVWVMRCHEMPQPVAEA